MATMTQEDLSTLFSRNLSFAPFSPAPPEIPRSPSPTPDQQPIQYSITQHYHHSSHQVSQPTSQSQSLPTQTHSDPQNQTKDLLKAHNIEPDSLFPSQLSLFHNASQDQQRRLIELWQISPPNYGNHALAEDLGSWPPTSVQQEEEMARLRYERSTRQDEGRKWGFSELHQQQEYPQQYEHEHPYNRNGNNFMNSGPAISAASTTSTPAAEPYMLTGYEMLSRRDYEDQSRHLQQQNISQSTNPSNDQHNHQYNQSMDPVYQFQQGQGMDFVGQNTQSGAGGAEKGGLFGAWNAVTPPGMCVGIHGGMMDEEMV
ncbi:MAG: hypothetical protein M1819_002265 [Sarea resinae]|nr:MAG: hypothetical protein M1819_002265 [Sarea resinae]